MKANYQGKRAQDRGRWLDFAPALAVTSVLGRIPANLAQISGHGMSLGARVDGLHGRHFSTGGDGREVSQIVKYLTSSTVKSDRLRRSTKRLHIDTSSLFASCAVCLPLV